MNGSVFRRYTFGHDLISENQLIASVWSPSFYGYDGHGSVRLLTNGAGLVTDTYTYDAFGQLIQSTGSTPNDYRYSGEQLDPNLGLYYLRARYLNAANGRFWTQDSWEGDEEAPESLHKYKFAADNAVNTIDPSGQFGIDATFSLLPMLDTFNGFGGSVVDKYQPQTLYMRAFAPWKTFGGGFAGDNRKFTTVHARVLRRE